VEQSIVGSLINFRGLVYSPINEQGVVFLFGRVLEDLNLYIEEIRIKYPDCVARRYTGKGWERVYIEFEFKASAFISHDHDPSECNIIVCWENDLSKEDKKKLPGIEIIELSTLIDELENKPIDEPDKSDQKSVYDLQHHYKTRNVSKNIQKFYEKLNKGILEIDENIFNKYAKTAVTYYSPERTFVYLKFRKTVMNLHVYRNKANIQGVKPVKYHENWGNISIKNEVDLKTAIVAIKKSHNQIKRAIAENINTGWYAITPKEKLSWKKADESEEDSE